MPGLGAFLFAALALAMVLAGLRPDPRTWGVHAYAFLPREAWIGSTLVLAAFLVPAVAVRGGRFAERVGELLVRRWAVSIGVALVAAVGFYAVRLEGQFLGDGLVWVTALADGKTFHHFEPLATALTRALAIALAPQSPATASGALSILLGPVYIVVITSLCRLLWREPGIRGVCCLLLLLHPVLLLFCGYVESYSLLIVLEGAFVLALVGTAERRVPLFVPAVLLGFGMAAHLEAVAWGPALVVFAWRRRPAGRTAAVQTAGVVVLALVVAVTMIGAIGGAPVTLLRDVFGHSGLGGQSIAWMFSWRHAVDVVNESLLLLAPTFLLLAGSARARVGRAGETPPLWEAIATLGIGTLAVALFIEPRIGGARDWDLFSPLVLPALLCAGRAASTSSAATRGRAVAFALVLVAGWLAVGVDTGRSATRFEVLQDPRGPFSKFARGYANETLGIFFRNRDPEMARRAWQRATEANPMNARYFNNLGMEELRHNDVAAACAAFRRTLELGMDEYFTRINVANCDRQDGNFDAAERHYDRLIARWPQRAEAFAARGSVRVQRGQPEAALADLQIAVRMAPAAPDVYYSIGLAMQALGRTDEARAAWERTLQLDPNNTAAREKLQQLTTPPAAP